MSPRSRLSIALVSTALVAYVALGSLLGRVLGDSTYGQLALFGEVVNVVLNSYVEPVNLDRAMGGARLGLTEALDGDSGWLDDEEFRAYTQPARAEGDVGLVLTRRVSFLMVVSTRAGSPAAKAGLRPGDLLKTIDGRHSRGLSPFVGQRLLRGAPGSIVKLSLYRSGAEPLEVSLVRERVAAPATSGRLLPGGTGHLRVPEVTPRSAEEIRGEIESLRRAGATRLVLDLRGAAYGSPADGVKVAELFLKGGAIGKLTGATVPEQVFTADPARSAWSGPLAVTTDHGTAGAAEVVAAALLDAGRAEIVGRRTFGRAAVSKAVPLEEGGLVLTVARYHRPKGEVIHGQGVQPSVVVDAADDEDEEADAAASPEEAGDAILERALEVLDGAAQKKAA
jgi:carboxyl-terminal processing protease